MHDDERRRRTRCLRRLPATRWERTQIARRQTITSARVGGAGAARRDWYHQEVGPRLDRATEEYACMEQADADGVHVPSSATGACAALLAFFLLVGMCYSPCVCSEARYGRDGLSAYV